jgi:hypothetical protein
VTAVSGQGSDLVRLLLTACSKVVGRAGALRSEDDPEVRKLLGRGWRLGAEDFLGRLEERIMGTLSDNYDPEQVAE